MQYPENDDDFVEGEVTWVKDEGDYLKIRHKVNWLRGPFEGCFRQPKPDFEVRVGMKIRIYAFQGLPERGVFIDDRVVSPYLTPEEGRDKISEIGRALGKRAGRLRANIQTQRSRRDGETP